MLLFYFFLFQWLFLDYLARGLILSFLHYKVFSFFIDSSTLRWPQAGMVTSLQRQLEKFSNVAQIQNNTLYMYFTSVHAFCWTGQENNTPTCRTAGNYYVFCQSMCIVFEPVECESNTIPLIGSVLDFRGITIVSPLPVGGSCLSLKSVGLL